MVFQFKISNKNLQINSNDLDKTEFLIYSNPYSYTVKFVNKIELNDVLVENKKNNRKKNFLFVDKKVHELYGELLWSKSPVINFSAIEKNKTIDSSLILVDALVKNNFTKKEKLVTIGGGITQDVTAFSRAIFKRGIDWIYIPTTLLSMSDSCIGAKSAINYGKTKNLLGLFSAPKEIYINSDFLKTLSIKEILSGYGEIVKLCIIGGGEMIKKIENVDFSNQFSLLDNISYLIKSSLLVKKAVIEIDEFELGIRKALNYGHTIGHALEPLVNYKIPHGIAVLIGMFIENLISMKYGYLGKRDCEKLNDLIIKFIDKSSINNLKKISIDKLFVNMEKDKKNENLNISFAVPLEIGHFSIIQIKNNQNLRNAVKSAIRNLVEKK